MTTRGATLAALLAVLGRPAWWVLGLAGFLARGGIVLFLLAIVTLPSPLALSNVLAPMLVPIVFGGVTPILIVVIATAIGGLVAWILLGAWIGAATEVALIVDARRAAGEEGVPIARRHEPGRWLISRVAVARLIAHVPLAIAISFGSVRIIASAYIELTTPVEVATPLPLRIIGGAVGPIVAIVVTWLIGEIAGGWAARRIVLGGGSILGSVTGGYGDLVSHPRSTLLPALLTTGLLALDLAAMLAAVDLRLDGSPNPARRAAGGRDRDRPGAGVVRGDLVPRAPRRRLDRRLAKRGHDVRGGAARGCRRPRGHPGRMEPKGWPRTGHSGYPRTAVRGIGRRASGWEPVSPARGEMGPTQRGSSMATKTVVCPECGSEAVAGRFACGECGALVAARGCCTATLDLDCGRRARRGASRRCRGGRDRRADRARLGRSRGGRGDAKRSRPTVRRRARGGRDHRRAGACRPRAARASRGCDRARRRGRTGSACPDPEPAPIDAPAPPAAARPPAASAVPAWPPDGAERPVPRPVPRTPAGAYLSPSAAPPVVEQPDRPPTAPDPAATAAAATATTAEGEADGVPRASLAETLGAFGDHRRRATPPDRRRGRDRRSRLPPALGERPRRQRHRSAAT